jgi:hypothetical protein
MERWDSREEKKRSFWALMNRLASGAVLSCSPPNWMGPEISCWSDSGTAEVWIKTVLK